MRMIPSTVLKHLLEVKAKPLDGDGHPHNKYKQRKGKTLSLLHCYDKVIDRGYPAGEGNNNRHLSCMVAMCKVNGWSVEEITGYCRTYIQGDTLKTLGKQVEGYYNGN